MGLVNSVMIAAFILAGLVGVFIGDVHGACFIDGYVEIEDIYGGGPSACFRFTDEKGDYDTQKLRCQVDGTSSGLSTSLATLLDADDGKWLFNINYYISQNEDLQDEAFFIDGTDEGHEGMWMRTERGISPMDMNDQYWGPGQPDQGTDANVACLYTPDFLFNSCKDSKNIKALCQL